MIEKKFFLILYYFYLYVQTTAIKILLIFWNSNYRVHDTRRLLRNMLCLYLLTFYDWRVRSNVRLRIDRNEWTYATMALGRATSLGGESAKGGGRSPTLFQVMFSAKPRPTSVGAVASRRSHVCYYHLSLTAS